MTRKLAALVLLLGLAIFGIVRAQERPTSTPVLTQPPAAAPVFSAPVSRWGTGVENAAPAKDTVSSGVPASPDLSGAQALGGEAESGEEDGLRSVLKRRSGTAPATEPQEPANFGGSESSRRAPPVLQPATPEGDRSTPNYTARTPANRATSPRDAAGPGNLLLRGQLPSVRIETVGPSALTVGKPAAYRILAINESSDSARDVVVEIGLPASATVEGLQASAGEAKTATGFSGWVWRIPAMAGGAREQLELQLTPRDDQPLQLAIDWSLRAPSLVTTLQVQKPALDVQITGPEDIVYGASQVYTITISNPGTGPAENVSLDVSTGGNGQAKRIGTIEPGGQHQIRMELVAREAGDLEIKATAHGDGLRHEALRKILVRRAELAVAVAGPGLKFAGSTGVYEVKVANLGNAVATNVEVSVKMPAGARYVAGVEGATEAAGRLTWKLNELAMQDQRQYAIEVAYEKAGSLQCEVHAAAAGELASTAQCQTVVEALADLKLVVNDPQGPKAVGEEVVFEIRVTNRGTKAAQSVNVLGQFSNGVEPIRAEGGAAELVPGQVIFRDLPRVEAGETVTLKIIARADKAGNHRFRAVLKCQDPDTQLIAEDMTRFFGEDLNSANRGGTIRR